LCGPIEKQGPRGKVEESAGEKEKAATIRIIALGLWTA
jgi:hypothetical protein